MDPGGVLAICCHSDGCIRLYDLASGQLMWRAWGHASYVAAATVLPNLSQLVSVGGDGCVVVWELPDSLAAQLKAAAADVAAAAQQHGGSPLLLPPSTDSTAGVRALRSASPPSAGSAARVTTPSSCTSEGGMGSTLRRIRQGKPLVSTDKLPRWARSSPTETAQHSSDGGARKQRQQLQQQHLQRHSKWLSGRSSQQEACEQDGQDATRIAAEASMSDPGTQVRAASHMHVTCVTNIALLCWQLRQLCVPACFWWLESYTTVCHKHMLRALLCVWDACRVPRLKQPQPP